MLPLTAPATIHAPELRLDDLLPLTPAQTGMLFESLGSSDPSMYFEQVRFDLVGPLDLDRFRAAWETMHVRHAMLRSVFLWDGLDDPLQAVLREVELDWNLIEASAVAASERSPIDVAEGRAVRRRAEGIDLGRSPISTFDLIRIDDQRTHVIWSFHHLLLDGWSTARVVGDVLELYEAGPHGESADNQVADGAEGSSFRPYLEWLADRDVAATTEFWRSLLAGVTEPTTLGGHRPRTGARPGTDSVLEPGGAGDAGFERGRIDHALTAHDSQRIRATAAANRVTINTMVQAAWARTLARYSGRADVVFGVTVSGRPPELDGANETVGMFLNTLPFPVTVPADDGDLAWLPSVQRQQLDVSHHGHASLAEVQRLAPLAAGSTRLFDSILVFENYPMRTAGENTSIRVEHYGVFEQSHYPLTIMAGDLPDDGAIGFIVVYDESVLAPWFARQLIDDFTGALVALGIAGEASDGTGRSSAPQASDALATGDDALSATITATVDHSTVNAAFAHRANANADDLALRCGDASLTFAQLDARATTVAAELQSRGVGPEIPVGIAIERSIEMVVAILGVVKAGGCYLALDPSHPIERTAGIVADAQTPIVLVADDAANSAMANAVAAGSSGPGANGSVGGDRLPPTVLDLRSLADVTGVDAVPPVTTGDTTLFLTFTSGSTGRPKGVPVHHRGVLRRLAWQYLTYPPTTGEVGIAKTTLGFVDHLSELWGPLLAGQTVVLAPDAIVKDVAAFIDLCAAEQIRRLVVVPSYLEAMLDAVPDLGHTLEHLRYLTTSGEALPPALAHRVAAAFDLGGSESDTTTRQLTLLNIYGMSEATADVTAEAFTLGELAALSEHQTVPAGQPLPGLSVAITSETGRPLPFGVVGSIDVAGAALSAGYWHRSDLTSERFVERPGTDDTGERPGTDDTGERPGTDDTGERPGAEGNGERPGAEGNGERPGAEGTGERWYRTGDLGWLEPSGRLHVVGRSDHQVKVRGMRVELGEIESAFERHPSVARSVAVLRDATDVVVFVIPTAASGTARLPTSADLRAHAASLLPNYMLPAAITVVHQLPATPSGKLDRRELERRSSDPSTFALDDESSARSPSAAAGNGSAQAGTDTDLAAMLSLWGQVLPHAELGPDSDFFDAGGHSLLALRLLTRLNAAFDAELSLAQVLQAPTPRRLTQLVGRTATAHEPSAFDYLVPIVSSPNGTDRSGERPTVFCVHGAGGNVLNFRPLAKVIEPAFDMIGIQARGVDGVAKPHSSMTEVVADYLPAIRAHQPNGPYLLAGYSGGGTIAVELARALEAEGETVEATLLLDTFHNDTRPRPFTREQHLQQLRRRGIGYLIEKITDRVKPSESEDFEPLVVAAHAAGRPIPLEAREWFIKGRMYELIGHHRIERYDGTVVLFAATDTHPGLIHAGHDHGLGEVFPNLEIIDVEGDHQSLVEGHNAPELGRLLLDRLGADATVHGAGTRGGAAGSDDGALDAHQHVYRHLPTGLDESPLLARFVTAGHTVLDVGTAATGRSALAMEALGAQVVSIEINHRATREFAASDEFAASTIELTTADMAQLPFAEASFDTVLVAFHGFDYLVDPAVRAQAIADLARVLRPGGHLIFNSFNTLGILATPAGARSLAGWKRRLRFVRSGELRDRRLIDDNGLGLHHGRPGQIIGEVERSSPLRFETITTLSGNERHRLVVSFLAPEPNYVFTKH